MSNEMVSDSTLTFAKFNIILGNFYYLLLLGRISHVVLSDTGAIVQLLGYDLKIPCGSAKFQASR